MNDRVSTDRRAEIARLAAQHGCNPRTAARMLRREAGKVHASNRQAVEVAAHLDWGNTTDVAPEVRDMAELITRQGVRCVSNSERNKIARGFSTAIQVAR